jgi:coenzyme F420 hydrogenase subunit beta
MVKYFIHLMEEVVKPGFCNSCGACVASCPFDSLEMKDGEPHLKDKCYLCGICFEQCPQIAERSKLERGIFGKSPIKEPTGFFKRGLSARARDAQIRIKAQDGGVVTALLDALLRDGFIDGAVVMGNSLWQPTPRVATTREELMECSGSKYSAGPLLLSLRDAADLYYRDSLAVVGTPCQIRAMRQMQLSPLANYRLAGRVKLCIGLFCWRAFSYQGFFKDVVEKRLGIPLAEVAKFDIKEGKFMIYRKGKPRRDISLESITGFAFPPCKWCSDFSSEFSDLSVGSSGSPQGYSTVLLRTKAGVEAFDRAAGALEVTDLDKVEPGLKAVAHVSTRKRRMARNELQRLAGKQMPSSVEGEKKAPMPVGLEAELLFLKEFRDETDRPRLVGANRRPHYHSRYSKPR